MRICLDYDGVITANIQHYAQLSRDFIKSGHSVYILTGANPKRVKEIENYLLNSCFPFTRMITRPEELVSTPKNIGMWKKEQLEKWNVTLWFDNEVKIYEQAGISFKDIQVQIVRI